MPAMHHLMQVVVVSALLTGCQSIHMSPISQSAGPDPVPASQPEDALASVRWANAEIARLRKEAAGMKDIQSLSEKIQEYDQWANIGKADLEIQLSKLKDTDDYRAYLKQLQAIEDQREAQWEIDRKKMGEEARKYYAARHADLAAHAPADLPGARALGFDVLSYPRVDGSTSTQPLSVILACRVLGLKYEWEYPPSIGRPWKPSPEMEQGFLWNANDPRAWEFQISACRVLATGSDPATRRTAIMVNNLLASNTDTHTAYMNLIGGACDVNLTARPPSADELGAARERNVEIELVPIATDALVFMVNQKNTVQGLTLDQIKSIYQLRTRKWAEVGGTSAEIRPFLRELNSGSRELFDALVFKTPTDDNFKRQTAELYALTMGGPYSRITQEAEGIGYSVYYYEHFMSMSPYTRNLAINGVEPNADTLASGKYPLTTPVYAALRKSDPPSAPGRKLVQYLLSPEGKSLLQETGYVPSK